MAKMTIAKKVETNELELKGMTRQALTSWAKNNGMDSRSGFSTFKKALLKIGIDYDEMREEERSSRLGKIESRVTHVVTLYSDAKSKFNRFGITNAEGNPVWYGKFFDSDNDYDGEQSSGEMAAAKKAVWLASKIAESVRGFVRLVLFVDAEWLTWATDSNNRGGKARALGSAAEKLGIDLDVRWVRGSENPADDYTVCSGFKSWKDNDLAALAVSVKVEEAVETV